jgi:hypothetical protein
MFDFTGGLSVGKGRREILLENRGEVLDVLCLA